MACPLSDNMQIKFGPQSSIVITSPKLLREYVDLKGAVTSDRPPVYVDELISNSMELPLMRYGIYILSLSPLCICS